jgi:ATP-dependent DNA helicase RecG
MSKSWKTICSQRCVQRQNSISNFRRRLNDTGLTAKMFWHFYIPSSDIKPVYFNGIQNTFIRTGSGDQQASEFEINALYRDQAFGVMSEKPVNGTSVDSLNKASYKRFREYLKGFNPNQHYNSMEDDEFNQRLKIVIYLQTGLIMLIGLLAKTAF